MNEIVTEDAESDAPPPSVLAHVETKNGRKSKVEAKADEVDADEQDSKNSADKIEMTAALKSIRAAEDSELKDVLDALGPDGSFQIRVSRIEPTEWGDGTGKKVKVDGFLRKYHQKIDEEFIQKAHGGGRFVVKVVKRNAKGAWTFFTQRTIDIGGDPKIDDVPRTIPVPAVAGAAPQESSTMVNKTFDILTKQLDEARKDAREPHDDDDRGMSPEAKMLLDMMQKSIDARDAEIRELRRDVAEQRNIKPPDDTFKESMLKRFVEDDGNRIQAVRLTYETEIRVLKEGQHQQEERIRDRAERDMQRLVESHNREIANMRANAETLAAASKMAVDTQIALLKEDNRKLERDNAELRAEVKELRAKKDKSLVDQAREINEVREALGENDGEKSTVDKIIEALPAIPGVMATIKGAMGSAAPAAKPVVAAAPSAQERRIVRNNQGEKFMLQGNQLIPVKAKKDIVQAAPGEPPLPQLDVATVNTVVSYLEQAYRSNTEPAIVAQSGRPMIPDNVLVALRDCGVDDFLRKVAKIPSDSPLSTMAGRNWARKVAEALLG